MQGFQDRHVDRNVAKTDLLAIASPGSRALKNAKYEKYCRLRASAQPRIPAYREAGWETSDDDDAYSNACRLERRPGVRERIEYLSRQDEELIAEKRRRIEGQLWAIHEADIGDFFETVEAAKSDKDGKAATDETGKMLTVKKQRPRLLSDLPQDVRKAIEHVQLDARGNVVPQLYSKLQANAELRKMLNIGGQKDRPETDVSRLSDTELIQQLADQAKELGIEIDLNYSFAQPKKSDE
jgi:Terminase small subunit